MSSPYLTFWSLHHKLFPYYLQQLFPALLILRINNAHYLPEGTDKFYLSLLGWSLAVMHVIDAVLDSFTRLFRHHRYSPLEKLYSVILFIAGLSLRDVSERFCLTFASRESVRIWAHRSSSLFKPSKRARRLVAVDETVLKVNGRICYLWCYRRRYWPYSQLSS